MSDENNIFENNDQNNGQTVNEAPVGNNSYSYESQPSGSNYSYEPSGNNYSSGKGQSTGLGIASMVCGICSIVLICCVYTGAAILAYVAPILGIVAIVLGIVQIVKNEKKGMAIAGIVCGAIGLLIFIGLMCIGIWVISSYGGLDEFLNEFGYSYY